MNFSFLLTLLISLNISITLTSKPKPHENNPNTNNKADNIISFTLDNGICGEGENYTYFIRPGNPKYVSFIFRGLGFCYDEITCTTLGNTNIDEEFNTLLLSQYPQYTKNGPFNTKSLTWTLILLPQCTEDFHSGYSSIDIGGSIGTFHFQGARNIDLIINQIKNGTSNNNKDDGRLGPRREKDISDYVNFDIIEHMVVLGLSGGSYDAALWSYQIFDYINEYSLKTLILDSMWLNDSLELLIAPVLVGLYDGEGSPAFVDQLRDMINDGDAPLLKDLIYLNQEKYCDLFVSMVYYEIDPTLQGYHYYFEGDISVYDEQIWKDLFYNDILNRYSYDKKRTSLYIAEGSGHMTFLDRNWNNISIKCNEAPTLDEYINDVIGDKDLVKKYYGEPQKRIRDFPKYSWVNFDIECLQCDVDNNVYNITSE